MDDPKSSPRRLRPKKTSPKPAASQSPDLSSADISALNLFCNDLNYEEISFESWQKTLGDLDLVVPLWVSPELASLGGENVVRFHRNVRKSHKSAGTREPVSYAFTLPGATQQGDIFVYSAQGDRLADKAGDLIIIIRFK